MSVKMDFETNDEIIYPDISIIVPTLNAESTIGKFFECINKQIYKGKIEILMIDGG